jgi:methanogenic corrinoid protein MtbC1
MRSLNNSVFPINALPSCQLVDEGVEEMCRNWEVKFRAARRYCDQVDADLLFFFSDIAIQAEAMGAPTTYSQTAMPMVSGPAKAIHQPLATHVDRMKVNAKVVRALAAEFADKMVSTMVYGPFKVAGQLAGEQKILREIVENADRVHSLLEKTVEVARSYASILLEAGANVLWVSDPLAALLPPDSFQEFAGHLLARLFELHRSGPTVLHICGDTTLVVEQMLSTGAVRISFDQCMDLLAIEDLVPHQEYLEKLSDFTHRGDRSAVSGLLKQKKERRIDPLMIINASLMRAVRKGSARYETRQCFLPEILLMIDAFYEGYNALDLDSAVRKDRPFQVVLGTVQGDIHEIGKDLVRIILEANGLKVLDLGANIPSEQFIEACNSTGAPILALSVFITSARKQLVNTVNFPFRSGHKAAFHPRSRKSINSWSLCRS